MSLIVRPMGANLTRDTEILGRMDPYCVVSCGGQRQMTEVCQDGSKNPSWGTALNFQAQNQILGVQVWDKDVMTADNLVGEGSVQIGHIGPGQSAAVMCELRYKGRPAGFVNLNVQHQVGYGMGMGMGGGMGMGMGMDMGMGGFQGGMGGFGGNPYGGNPYGGGGNFYGGGYY